MEERSRPLLVPLMVRLRPGQLDAVRSLAEDSQASLGQVVRSLVDAGLEAGGDSERRQAASQEATLASLMAAEQTLRLLQSWLPEGELRAAEVGVGLAEAVRRRLQAARSLERPDA